MINLDNETFKTMVTGNRFYSLVLFNSEWHNSFESSMEAIKKIVPKNEKLFIIGYVDVNKYPELVPENLKTLPYYAIYREGKIMKEFEDLYSHWELKVHLGDDLYELLIKVD